MQGGRRKGQWVRARLARARAALVAAAALCAGGCNLGPYYHRPDTPPPADWVTHAAPAAPEWPPADWWREFHSDDLNLLIAQAQHANDDLRAAIARVRQADAQARIAGAPLLPAVEAQATATRARGAVPGGGFVTANTFNPFVVASYELDFWGKNRARRAAAIETLHASSFDRTTVELTVMAGVASTYFQVLELRDRLAIADANLANATKTLEGLKLEERAGTANALDVAQQETVTATVNATIPPLRQQLRQSLDALAILTGATPESLEVRHGSLDELGQPEVRPGLPSQLLARRPDVAEAESNLMAANANIQAARAAFFPSFSLTAQGGYVSSDLNSLLNPGGRVWSLAAGVTQPIFQGGALAGQYRLSEARYEELLADYHKAVISAFGNVEDALIAVEQTTELVKRQGEATSQAQRAYRFAQMQMRAGTISVLTLLVTETALFNARDALAQAKLAHLEAIVSLYQALGGGWQGEAT
jgi:NodT family efflux transporter outer membrane factor (OMF) lipoprotein